MERQLHGAVEAVCESGSDRCQDEPGEESECADSDGGPRAGLVDRSRREEGSADLGDGEKWNETRDTARGL